MDKIPVACKVVLPSIDPENVEVQVYYGKIGEDGIMDNIQIKQMDLQQADKENKVYVYSSDIQLSNGGDYGYTFRVMPKHEMLLDSANLNTIKWITK